MQGMHRHTLLKVLFSQQACAGVHICMSYALGNTMTLLMILESSLLHTSHVRCVLG